MDLWRFLRAGERIVHVVKGWKQKTVQHACDTGLITSADNVRHTHSFIGHRSQHESIG